MENKAMTKREMFALIISANQDNQAIVDFCNKEIGLLDKKKEYKSSTLSKTQLENIPIKGAIDSVLQSISYPMTADAIRYVDASKNLGQYSTNKIASLIGQLIEEGKAVKGITPEGKVGYIAKK